MSIQSLLLSVIFLVSCSNVPIKQPLIKPAKNLPLPAPIIKLPVSFKNHFDFINQAKYPKTYDVYQNKELLALATPDNTSIEINTDTQRLLLLVNGLVAYDTPATTGSEKKQDVNDGEVVDKATPKGTYKILQKLKVKRSNIYGDFFYNGKKVYTGDVRKYQESYDEFIGVGMPYWMRFNSAIGMHYSDAVTRYPGSNGCVRLPMDSVRNVFSVVKVGTQVDVVGNTFNMPLDKPKLDE